MSNVEIVQAVYAAFERGDIESVIEALDPDIEWVEPEVEGLLYGGTYHGLNAVVSEVFGQMPQTWEWIAWDPTSGSTGTTP